MPYASRAQQRKFHAMEARGEIAHSTVHEYDEATKGMYGKLPEHKGAKHNDRKDFGSAGNKHEEPEQKAKGGGETPDKPMARGHLKGRAEGGNTHKGEAYGGEKREFDGDVSGNEHEGEARVAHSHQHDHVHEDTHSHEASHTHHHEDIHIHLAPGHSPGETPLDPTSAMHANAHSGFNRPAYGSAGVVPMYSASQQGVTMNDAHTGGSGQNAFAARGSAAPGHVRGKSNPVKKGRG